jgi:diadenylate cyclase
MFDLFKIGFLTFTFLDFIDIVLVTFIFYKVYMIIRGTIAAQILFGLILVLFLSFVTQTANFKALGWILRLLSDIWVISFVILFQPEIRRLLVILGQSPFIHWLIRNDESNVASIIADSSYELAQHQHGALIVVVKSIGIRSIAEAGEILDAKLKKNLLRSIFFPRSPLHDGAVIIKGDLIEAARCTLPLSVVTIKDGKPLGMRHRAGLGISEQADVVSVIVSEESGSISIAENGKLITGLSREGLKNYLSNALGGSKSKKYKKVNRDDKE